MTGRRVGALIGPAQLPGALGERAGDGTADATGSHLLVHHASLDAATPHADARLTWPVVRDQQPFLLPTRPLQQVAFTLVGAVIGATHSLLVLQVALGGAHAPRGAASHHALPVLAADHTRTRRCTGRAGASSASHIHGDNGRGIEGHEGGGVGGVGGGGGGGR